MRKINEIIIHCSDTQEGVNVTAADIRRWHTTPREKGGRGFRDIGYHLVIDIDGKVETGRDFDVIGAHCADHNAHSIGICYVGGRRVEKNGKWHWADTRTEAQKKSLIILVAVIMAWYDLEPSCIHGHNEYAAKACPCFDVQQWVKDEFMPWYEENRPSVYAAVKEIKEEKITDKKK